MRDRLNNARLRFASFGITLSIGGNVLRLKRLHSVWHTAC
jgi:hypothetical protein